MAASAGTGVELLRVSGQRTALLSTRSSSRSDGRLTWTGPGRPDVAIRIASPRSRPRFAADGDHGHTGFAGETSPRIGHVHRGGFVAHVYEIELRLQRRIEDRHDVIAR